MELITLPVVLQAIPGIISLIRAGFLVVEDFIAWVQSRQGLSVAQANAAIAVLRAELEKLDAEVQAAPTPDVPEGD